MLLTVPKNNQTKITNMQTSKNGRKITFMTNGKENTIIIGKYYFPGWSVQADSRINLPAIPYGKNGLISFTVPRGNHTLTIEFKDTPVRYISNIISLFSSVIVTILVLTIIATHNLRYNKKTVSAKHA